MKAGNRPFKIIIQRQGAPTDDGYNEVPGEFEDYATEYAAIFWGTGREQREAAQETGSQTASFEVLSNNKTRSLSVTDRICYPITEPNAEDWPVWDIQAIAELGMNNGIRITATRAAT